MADDRNRDTRSGKPGCDERRVIVGVDGSLASMGALRRAVEEVRRTGAALHVVTVVPEARHYAYAAGIPNPDTVETLAAGVRTRMLAIFEETMGGVPDDLPVHLNVTVGPVGPTLSEFAYRPTDLLVLGSDGHPGLRGWLRPSVTRYCVEHADCPVLAVPLPPLARATRRIHLPRHVKDVDSLLRA